MSTDAAARLNIAEETENASPLQRLLGYRLVQWEPDRAVVAYTIQPDHLNRTHRLHGGILAALLDTAAGFSGCFSPVAGERRTALTLSLTVNFIASVAEGALSIEARRTGGGRSIFFAEASIRDAGGTLVAAATGTFRYLPRD